MANIKKELADMLNEALKLEHAARIQYLAHAELIKGIDAEPVIARLKEIASDETKHEEMFREMISSYLDGEPTMDLATTHRAQGTDAILKINLQNEKEAVDFYQTIHQKIMDNKQELLYIFERLEHEIRHIILDEEEHIAELSLLLSI